MKFTGVNLQILDKIGIQRLSFPEVTTPVNPDLLQSKNVILSGEFYHLEDNSIINNFHKRETNIQPDITPDTEILICGQFPDWMLVEEARLYGIRIIFADKAGELFSRMATKLCKSRKQVLSIEEIMG